MTRDPGQVTSGNDPMLVRREKPEDRSSVFALNESAFETADEARLVDALREQADPLVSLVAVVAGQLVGHIMLSPVSLMGHPDLRIMGLAPMAVEPGHQRRGIGSALVRAGLEHCRQLGFGAVVVLGHANYYPRFGFRPSARFGIECEYDVPEDVFMALELERGYFDDRSGTIRYGAAFSDV